MKTLGKIPGIMREGKATMISSLSFARQTAIAELTNHGSPRKFFAVVSGMAFLIREHRVWACGRRNYLKFMVIVALVSLFQISSVNATQSATAAANSPDSFDIASIKPDHSSGDRVRISFSGNSLTASGVTLKRLIEFAYNMDDSQVSGGPAWVNSEKYAVQAKVGDSGIEALNKLSVAERQEQRRIMVQSLLAERFKLKVSRSKKELPVFFLVVSKKGPKFSGTNSSGNASTGISSTAGETTVRGGSMGSFADWLSHHIGRKVVDNTGLQGRYDFSLHWTPEKQTPVGGGTSDTGSVDTGPSIFTALDEQLGLKLESKKAPVDTLVIDSVEKPSEN